MGRLSTWEARLRDDWATAPSIALRAWLSRGRLNRPFADRTSAALVGERSSSHTLRRQLRVLGCTWEHSRYVLEPPPPAGEEKADVDTWLAEYNETRPHSGKYCFGKTPMQTLLDSVPLAKRKLSQTIQTTAGLA